MAALVFKALVAYRIHNDVIRITSVGFAYLAALLGCLWCALPPLIGSAIDPANAYSIANISIDDAYYFTRQGYGFVTMVSHGYSLTFYQRRPFWFDKELGKVQLECASQELVRATIAPAGNEHVRLQIVADNQVRLDTTLGVVRSFDFQRTLEDRTRNFSQRP
ncbi:hypothetical protein [Hymenobacter psoromatis]|uniref:hypothetical protein n=1 Tax=Hymenobacter psoromatis TaxID=1484116 RepID=UPI001CBD77E3|nr:hypothetical protein [Hymenobacter psoromatis]